MTFNIGFLLFPNITSSTWPALTRSSRDSPMPKSILSGRAGNRWRRTAQCMITHASRKRDPRLIASAP